MRKNKISVIIPAKNESVGLSRILPQLRAAYQDFEIIVVDDGSEDETASVVLEHNCKLVRHLHSIGNGAAIKSGVRAAEGDVFIFMDADGQHNPDDISRLLEKYESGYDMVVGNRDSKSQASFGRLAANRVYNSLASWMVGFRIRDLTSGFRVVDADKFREFVYLLPNGFSYPTTCTMAFFRAGYSVGYEGITAAKREGRSHINIGRDGIKFLLIIFKVGTLYSPLKMFTPISAALFLLGASYYAYTYFTVARFTNMSALLMSTSLTVFLLGLISEQITMLHYSNRR